MVFGGGGSCGAEVTFGAASAWVLGRRFDVSDRFHTEGVPPETLGTSTSLKLLQNAPENTFK